MTQTVWSLPNCWQIRLHLIYYQWYNWLVDEAHTWNPIRSKSFGSAWNACCIDLPVKSAEIAESRANILPKLWRFPPAIFWVWVGTGSGLTVGLCRPWWKKRQGKYSLVSGLQISRQSPGELALGYVRDS